MVELMSRLEQDMKVQIEENITTLEQNFVT